MNVRGDTIEKKKELLAELEQLEALEENQILSGTQYVRKGFVQSFVMKTYDEEE